MCQRTGIPPALVCTVGDLKPGQWYHDPNGETWMVVSDQPIARNEDTRVVNIGNRRGGNQNVFGNALNNDELMGTLTPVRSSTKLGPDRDGRLYSSTYLNGWYCDPTPEPTREELEKAGLVEGPNYRDFPKPEVVDEAQEYLDRDLAAQRALEEQLNDETPDSVAPDAYDDDDAFPVDLGGES